MCVFEIFYFVWRIVAKRFNFNLIVKNIVFGTFYIFFNIFIHPRNNHHVLSIRWSFLLFQIKYCGLRCNYPKERGKDCNYFTVSTLFPDHYSISCYRIHCFFCLCEGIGESLEKIWILYIILKESKYLVKFYISNLKWAEVSNSMDITGEH